MNQHTPTQYNMLYGGCLCGQIRYRIHGTPIDAGFCHCRLCQQSSGAPVLAWATFSATDVVYTSSSPAIHHSSAQAQREFCCQCGTQLMFRSHNHPEWVDVTLASLDLPDAIRPQYHIWTASRRAWLHVDDDLPQFADAGPDADDQRPEHP